MFLRRPVISAPRLMLDWLEWSPRRAEHGSTWTLIYPEGAWVGAGEPIVYITGSFAALSDLETILLQKLGPACVAAHNAYQMCLALPYVAFLAMEARHCAGAEMQEIMAYAASVGSDGGEARKARRASSATPTTARRTGSARRAASARCRIR